MDRGVGGGVFDVEAGEGAPETLGGVRLLVFDEETGATDLLTPAAVLAGDVIGDFLASVALISFALFSFSFAGDFLPTPARSGIELEAATSEASRMKIDIHELELHNRMSCRNKGTTLD